MTTLQQLQSDWEDTPEFHELIHELFCNNVNDNEKLRRHRNYVEDYAHGFGERSFWWAWKLILDELSDKPSLLEIGVYKGSTLSVWQLLKPYAAIFGITPLDNSDGHLDLDYKAEIQKIHDNFDQEMPHIFHGRSDDRKVMNAATSLLYDVVYVDGSHTYEDALFDLVNYSKCVKSNGWLVVDDAACRTTQPFGYFQGIQSVCDALYDWEKTEQANDFVFLFNVVHIMIYKKV